MSSTVSRRSPKRKQSPKRSPKRSTKRSPKRSAKRSTKRSPKRSTKRSPKRSAKRLTKRSTKQSSSFSEEDPSKLYNETQKNYCSCVAKVKAKQGKSVNAFAVCTKSVGRTSKHCKQYEN